MFTNASNNVQTIQIGSGVLLSAGLDRAEAFRNDMSHAVGAIAISPTLHCP